MPPATLTVKSPPTTTISNEKLAGNFECDGLEFFSWTAELPAAKARDFELPIAEIAALKASKNPPTILLIRMNDGREFQVQFADGQVRDAMRAMLQPKTATSSSSKNDVKKPVARFALPTFVASSTAVSSSSATGTGTLPSDEIAMRKEILKNDPSLFESFNELVILSRTVTEEEFWENRKYLLNETQFLNKRQKTGISSEGLAEPLAKAGPGNRALEVTLTKAKIERILLEEPRVKELYARLVPFEMSEADFWTNYLYSRYVLGGNLTREVDAVASAAAATASSSKTERALREKSAQIFGDADEYLLERGAGGGANSSSVTTTTSPTPPVAPSDPRREILPTDDATNVSTKRVVHPSVDLIRTANDRVVPPPEEGFGIARELVEPGEARGARLEAGVMLSQRLISKGMFDAKKTPGMVEALIKNSDPTLSKYNKRSELALDPVGGSSSSATNEEVVSSTLRRARVNIDFRNSIEISGDLKDVGKPPAMMPGAAKLQLRGEWGGIPASSSSSSNAETSDELNHRALPFQAERYVEWRPDPSRLSFVLHRLSALASSASPTNATSIKSPISPLTSLKELGDDDVSRELLRSFHTTCELCRHYWAARADRKGAKRRAELAAKIQSTKTYVEGYAREMGKRDPRAGNLLLLSVAQLAKAIEDDEALRSSSVAKT